MCTPRRLLIVEDERIVAMDLRAELESLGYTVVGTAASCDEALVKAAESSPELALMDIRIKGDVDGIATAALLRERHQLPIVYLTANADQHTLGRALDTEPGGFLAKPYSARNLRTTIEVAFRRHDAERALREAHNVERRRFEQRSHELIALAERLGTEMNTDPLTQLRSRRYFDRFIKEQLRVAEQTGLAVGLILLDLDRFKRVNDSFGHVAGDQVLREVSAFLRDASRGEDAACRYGGEEIVIVVPGASLHDTFALAGRLRSGVESLRIEVGDHRLSITASFGVSAFPEHGLDAQRLLEAADLALYRAKDAGRNRVVAATLAT